MSAKMIELNLLPLEQREKMAPASKKLGLDIPHLIPMVLVGVVFILLGVNVLSFFAKNTANNELIRRQKKLKETKQKAERSEKLKEVLPELEKRNEYLTACIEKRLVCWEVMQQVSKCCPGEIEVRDMRISSTRDKNRVVIEGSYSAEDGDYIEQKFLKELKQNKALRSFFTHFSAERTPDPDGTTKFTVIGISK